MTGTAPIAEKVMAIAGQSLVASMSWRHVPTIHPWVQTGVRLPLCIMIM